MVRKLKSERSSPDTRISPTKNTETLRRTLVEFLNSEIDFDEISPGEVVGALNLVIYDVLSAADFESPSAVHRILSCVSQNNEKYLATQPKEN